MTEELPEHVRRNRAQWDVWAAEYAEPARRNWSEEPSWGMYGVSEHQLHVLPDELWCDPYLWIPEAARLLRPGGELIFLVSGVLVLLTLPDEEDAHATDRLLRPYFGMHRVEWSDDDSVEFHLPHGEMIALLRRCGLQLEELLEIRPPDGSTTRYPFITLEWAQRWPCEEVWKARKRGRPLAGRDVTSTGRS